MAIGDRAHSPDASRDQTLDLGAIAQVRPGERVRVEVPPDQVDTLYQRTVRLLPSEQEQAPDDGATLPLATLSHRPRVDGGGAQPRRVVPPATAHWSEGFLPSHAQLRQRYLLAEAVGGYEALHDLLNVYSPGLALIRKYATKVGDRPLAEPEVKALEEYQTQIRRALEKAHRYLTKRSLSRFSADEIQELRDLLAMATRRDKELTRVLGIHLIHEVEHAVTRLHELTMKINSVEQTISGVFLVNSEVMFIPTSELIHTVNCVFKAVGNPYLARHIDAVLLLAARNLLIQVVAFFSYYGKHQIYSLFRKGGSATSIIAVSFRIRVEIRKLFAACMKDNKLVLTRVMESTAREFEISVEAIKREAEASAIDAVRRIIPPEVPKTARTKRSWFKRLLGWFI